MYVRAGILGLMAGSLLAVEGIASVERSLFPMPRPGQNVPGQGVPGQPGAPSLRAAVPLPIAGIAPLRSLRPPERPANLGQQRDAALARWLRGFRSRALAQGIRTRVFERAFAGIALNSDILQHEAQQPEFNRPIWAYIDNAASVARIRDGRAMLREHRRVLDEIEARYGVDREVIVAIWGMESAYGNLRGTTRLIPALTTLAMHSRRSGFYEQQLIGALQILQAGDIDTRGLVGSWAGAMGHTQFIPTSYLDFAVDFRGDGRRDIWSDDPTDSLASTAAYLSRHGWERGQPWGVEVHVPHGFDSRLANSRRGVQDWIGMGLRAQRGAELPRSGEATLMFPAGSQGPALLVFGNFEVIKRYNNADAYAIGVGHLADRLRGDAAFVAEWPRDDRPLSRAEREELQRMLRHAGHYSGVIDGRVGSGTLTAVRDWQAANGMPPDGYVSLALLERMRR